jgi:hypothetical protein
VILSSACQLVAGIEPTTDTVGAVVPMSPDAAADAASEGAPPPTSCDAGTFCQCHRQALFCADFDDALPSGFESRQAGGPGITLELDPREHVSAPSSLLSVLGTGASLPAADYLTRYFKVVVTAATLDLDLRAESFATGQDLPVEIVLDSARHGIGLRLRPTSAEVQETGASPTVTALDGPVPRDRWVHLTLRLVFAPSPRLRIEADGALVHDKPLASSSVGADIGLRIGCIYGDSPGFRHNIDNVVLEVK